MVKKVTYKILKKGRKWFEGETPEGYKAKIEINEISRDWEVGKSYTFTADVVFEKNKFGTKVFVYPKDERKAQLETLMEEFERWKGYFENALEEGYIYEKGEDKIKRIAEKLREIGFEEKAEEIEEYLKQKIREFYAKQEEEKRRKAEKIAGELVKYEDVLEKVEDLLAEGPESVEDIEDFGIRLKEMLSDIREIASEAPSSLKEISPEANEILKRYAKISRMVGDTISFGRYVSKVLMEDSKERRVNGLYRALSTFSEKEIPGSVIKTVREEIDKLEKEIKEREMKELRELKEKYEKAFESLKYEFPEEDLIHLAKGGYLRNEEYTEVEIPDAWLIPEILKEMGGIVKVESEGYELDRKLIKEASTPSVALAALFMPQLLYREVKSYTWFFPESSLPKVNKVKEIMQNWKKEVYESLKKMEGTPVDEPKLPTSWNHLKKEYVAIVNEDLSLNFISTPVNFTSSGKNADLEVDLNAVSVGDVIVERSGSHKHLSHSFYRLDEDGWKYLLTIEEREWKNVKKELFNEFIIPKIEKTLNS